MTIASTIRLGTASPGTQQSTTATIALIGSLAHRASESKIDILLLPEAFIGGYPRGSSFGCVVGGRTDEGREEFVRYFDQAIDLGDTVGIGGGGAGLRWVKRQLSTETEARGDGSREELERIARDSGVFIVTGCIEKVGGSLYCAVVYICPKEGMIGKRRKVLPTGSERLIWAQAAPSTLRAVSTTIRGVRINLAAAICWENYMPLLRQTLYAQNINLYLAPTADNRDAWLGLMRTIGVEGRCFVVSSNMCVPSGDTNQVEFISRGGSSIVSPFGDVIAGPQWEEQYGLIFADVDFRDCIKGRLDLDAAGSYSRNDSFKLSVEGLDLEPLPY